MGCRLLDERRFEVFTAVRMMMLSFSPEDGDSMFLLNAGIHQRDYTAPKFSRTTASSCLEILLHSDFAKII
jgi:hypothetical protein